MSVERAPDGLPILILQPDWESKIFDFDFSAQLAKVGASSIATVDSVSQENAGVMQGSGDVTVGTPSSSGGRVQMRISAPASAKNENYKLTARITDDQGNNHEGEGWLYVRDL